MTRAIATCVGSALIVAMAAVYDPGLALTVLFPLLLALIMLGGIVRSSDLSSGSQSKPDTRKLLRPSSTQRLMIF